MTACRFVVTHIGIENNIRGVEMRRVRLRAVASDPFDSGPVPKGTTAGNPDGEISMLVSKAFAKELTLGGEMALEPR